MPNMGTPMVFVLLCALCAPCVSPRRENNFEGLSLVMSAISSENPRAACGLAGTPDHTEVVVRTGCTRWTGFLCNRIQPIHPVHPVKKAYVALPTDEQTNRRRDRLCPLCAFQRVDDRQQFIHLGDNRLLLIKRRKRNFKFVEMFVTKMFYRRARNVFPQFVQQ